MTSRLALIAPLVVAGTLGLVSPGSAQAEGILDAKSIQAAKAYDAASFANLVALPKGLEIANEDNATKVTFKAGGDISVAGDFGGSDVASFSDFKWSVGAEGLLDTLDGPIKLASLDGLARSANAEFKLQWITGRFEKQPDKSVRRVDNLNRVSFSAKVGAEKFEFVDPSTLAKRTERKSPWSVSLGYTMVNQAATDLFTVSGSYQEAYTPLDKKIMCPPGGVPDKCVDAIPGPPTRQHKSLISAEYRHLFDGFALSAAVTYDAENDVTGVEIPIYVPAANGELNAGVKLGWRSDTDEAVAAFFVNKPFSVAFFQ